MTDKPQAAGHMVMVPRELLQSARSFVELTYHDEGGEEAADAKHVMGEIDKSLSSSPQPQGVDARDEVIEVLEKRWKECRDACVSSEHSMAEQIGFGNRAGGILEAINILRRFKSTPPQPQPSGDAARIRKAMEIKLAQLTEYRKTLSDRTDESGKNARVITDGRLLQLEQDMALIDLIETAAPSHPPSTGDELRRAVIEECVRQADLRASVFGGEPTTRNERQIAEHIAAAIRALAQPQEGGGT